MTDLYDLVPHSHDGDPTSSHVAGDRHGRSGRRAGNAALVLALVRRSPGLTACELWESASIVDQATLKELQEVRRRLYDLHRTSQVVQGEQRHCRIRGSKQVTWTPVGG